MAQAHHGFRLDAAASPSHPPARSRPLAKHGLSIATVARDDNPHKGVLIDEFL